MAGKIAKKNYRRVGLLIETSHEFGRELLRGIRRYDQESHAHWGFFLLPGGMSQDMGSIKSLDCDGMIARLYGQTRLKLASIVEASGCPLIMVDPDRGLMNKEEKIWTNPVLTTHTDSIVGMVYTHLYESGCRHFAYVHSKVQTVWSERRDKVFTRIVKANGFACDIYRSIRKRKENAFEDDISRLGEWISRLPEGTGLFAAMDERGQNVLEACNEFGVRVPEDLLVIGIDNDPLLCDLCEPTLSSVAMNVEHAGFEAAELLHNIMEGKVSGKDVVINVEPTHIFRRESTANFFHQNPIVAKAKRYMLMHYSDSAMQMNDVVAHCGVSRRMMEAHFARSVGRTPLRFLTDIRMERAVALLIEQNYAVSEIGKMCGFSTANYFTKAFRHNLGFSPLNYLENMQK
ncbi:MAG: XylR family transcriptional regulator [Kiritimatiellae bacterium]|jgi:LacI family transcriptional regulator|nr:XylR family transcriptional regulator [Kiritimatiellia bacterium]